MAALPFSARTTAETFAESLGVPARAAPDGSIGFRFLQSGTLSLTPTSAPDRVVMSLAWRPADPTAAAERRLLDRAGADPITGEAIHTGMAPDGSFVCAFALDPGRLDLPTFDERLRMLLALRDQLE